MNAASAIFGLQVMTNLLICALVARWYLTPRLARLSVRDALTPLLLLQATRVIGLVFIVDAVTDPSLPRPLALTAALGDTLTAVLALIALTLLRRGLRGWRVTAWAMTVVGLVDLMVVAGWGIAIGFPNYELGAAWFIPTVLGPIMIVGHVLVIRLLTGRLGLAATAEAQAPSDPR